MKQIQRVYEIRSAKGYAADTSDPVTDEAAVQESLLQDMIAKHYWKARYIGSIKRHQNYDGTCNYTVVYKDDDRIVGRATYTVREH